MDGVAGACLSSLFSQQGEVRISAESQYGGQGSQRVRRDKCVK